ncbi:hypothetical protein ACXPWS_22215 [Mycobacterium sp. BMJ-28]
MARITRASLVAAALLSVVTGSVVACTTNSGPARDTGVTPTDDRFPELESYTPANPDEYQRQTENPGRPTSLTSFGFFTPDGVACTFTSLPSAACTSADLPGIPPAHCDKVTGKGSVYTMSTESGLRQFGSAFCQGGSTLRPRLPPFHRLTVYGVTCGVDDKGTTACKDPQGRGFVLSPSWSGWLPKI